MRVLKSYRFSAPAGRTPKYDWKAILNGNINMLVRGEDFEVSASSFRQQVYKAAEALGKSVQTSTLPPPGCFNTSECVIVRAY